MVKHDEQLNQLRGLLWLKDCKARKKSHRFAIQQTKTVGNNIRKQCSHRIATVEIRNEFYHSC